MNTVLRVFAALFELIFVLLFQYQLWILAVAFFAYLIWQNNRRREWVTQTDHTLLRIEVPRENEKKELSAEQMFASLHGILRPQTELLKEGSLQEHISFEISASGNQIAFYIWVPKHLKDFLEGQVYAQYPNVHITEEERDYTSAVAGERAIYGTELKLTKDDVLPIKTFPSFEVDPLAGITAVLGSLSEPDGEMWIQVLARPVDDSWHEKGLKYIDAIKGGKTSTWMQSLIKELLELPLYILANIMPGMAGLTSDKKDDKKKDEKKEEKLTTGQQAVVKAVEEKITRLGYTVKIRLAYIGTDAALARQRMQALIGAFKQYNTTNLNGFTAGKYRDDEDFLNDFRSRVFLGDGDLLNIEELASLYHLPHKSVETPNMGWTTTKTAEPPQTLPTELNTSAEEVSLFGQTNFRGQQLKFGIKRLDRGRHLYIIGQTGTGKSGLLKLLSLSDIYHNHGMAIIDPHGDFATDMLQYIPEHRIKDVVYFNPADRNFPMAFNPLEWIDEDSKNHLSSELIGVLKRMFESWGPRLEYILRFTILALLDYPDSTMLGITRMLTEKDFRKKVIKAVQDPVVKNFWVNEFASWNDKFANEAVAPVLNKVGAFTANPLIRNVIGQPKSTFDLRKIMDEGKILVVNLSRGQVGEDNAAILGALMVTKIQLAAMSRADVPMDDRKPFYLYVDEFQNFATDSFAVILSEARKYGLNLTVANQYIAQMPETVREAVFGNVGSMITFRVGAADATFLTKYFEPTFESGDLVKLNNRHIFSSMSIDGEKSTPFSATTLRMPDPTNDMTPQIIEHSRSSYAAPKADVEEEIRRWTNSALADVTEPAESGAPTGEPDSSPGEQKPNSFLSALKNPEQPNRPSSGDRSRGQRPNQGQRAPERGNPTDRQQIEKSEPQQAQANTSISSGAQNQSANRELHADEVIELRR